MATIRYELHPILAGASPLLIFVLPTVVMVMRHAWGPALCATVAGAGVALSLFIEPTDPAWWSNPAQRTRLAVFLAESVTIVSVGWLLHLHQRREVDGALQAERLRVVQVTMRTVQDVVNNSLNQLQLLRIDAEGRVPMASLVIFDATVQDTLAKLAALSNLTAYAERPMVMGAGLDPRTQPSTGADDPAKKTACPKCHQRNTVKTTGTKFTEIHVCSDCRETFTLKKPSPPEPNP